LEHQEKLAKVEEEKLKVATAAEQAELRKQKFFETINSSTDLNENLQELADFIEENTKATGVYIAKLVHQRKKIDEDALDNAHIDEEVPKVLQYTHTSKGHEFMTQKFLTPETGPITHGVFSEGQEEEPADDDAVSSPESDRAAPKITDILTTFKHVYVKQVVREPKMWFKRVPKLGSYMAVPLVYQSCLSDDALENAVAD
jgi:hypothetical protein